MNYRRLAVAMAVVATLFVAWAWSELRQPVRMTERSLTVTVLAGASPQHVLRQLDDEDHITFGIPLRLWLRLHNASGMKAGEYEIAAGATARELITRLLSGQIARRAFLFYEGWNFHQLRDALRQEKRLRPETAGMSDAAIMKRLGRPDIHPEGQFAPDTYFFSPHSSSDLDILTRALRAQDDRLADAWNNRATDLPYHDMHDLLVMASIIEKETGMASERAEIAGVFIRRLRIGMRLQTDPSVIYGLGLSFSGNLTRNDLRRPTRWNTYVIDGLPPTPISMPGRESLEAAAHPADGDALFFVGRGDGSHQFSATLDQHNAAVREYQLRRRADYRSTPDH